MSSPVTNLDRVVALLCEFTQQRVAAAQHLNSSLSNLWEHVETIASSGKHHRARLVLAAAGLDPDALSEAELPSHKVAAAFDLLHGAFLVHDDVIDGDDLRHGTQSVHAAAPGIFDREVGVPARQTPRFDQHSGNSFAIVVGDALISGAYRLIADCGAEDFITLGIIRLFDEAIQETVSGEILDIEYSKVGSGAITAQDVETASAAKTAAYSFIGPMLAGTMLIGASETRRIKITSIGRSLGFCYQLLDDLDGIYGTTDLTGKVECGDFLENRSTTLLSAAQRSPLWTEIRQIRGYDAADFARIRALIAQTGAPHEVATKAEEIAQSAQKTAENWTIPTLRAEVSALCEILQSRAANYLSLAAVS